MKSLGPPSGPGARVPAEVCFGPLTLTVEESEDAWWVVDGQQRLTSLVAGLQHPNPNDPNDPFVVYFDLRADHRLPSFFRPNRLRPATPFCLPITRCFDAVGFQEWLFDFAQHDGAREYIRRASDVATRIRNYRVPIYEFETDDPEVAREIFLRTNRAGRRLDAHEVFAALAPITGDHRLRPVDIAGRIEGGFGPIDPNVVSKVAIALVSDDVTRSDTELDVADRDALMIAAESALIAALTFLRQCRVPHTRLLPAVQTTVMTLASFFHRHPTPHDRSRRLLRRWLWRGFFSEGLASDARTLRRAVVAVTDDEHESVQRLLAQVTRSPPPIHLEAGFDARQGRSRLFALVLALLDPAGPTPEAPTLFDNQDDDPVFDWLQQHGAHAFSSFPDVDNSAAAAKALRDRNFSQFIKHRSEALTEAAQALLLAMGEPGHSDRPPLLLAETR